MSESYVTAAIDRLRPDTHSVARLIITSPEYGVHRLEAVQDAVEGCNNYNDFYNYPML